MNLLDNFYEVLDAKLEDNIINSRIKINSNHKIFTGHFPEKPVTPGVVQLELIKEILNQQLKKELTLKKIKNCKFLAVLDPITSSTINVEIIINDLDTKETSIVAKLFYEETVFMKISSIYHVI